MSFECLEIEDFAPFGMSTWIESRVIHNLDWSYNQATSSVGNNIDNQDKNIVETPQFTNIFFDQDKGPMNSLFSEIAQPLIWNLEKETGIQVEGLGRIKANLLLPHPNLKSTNYHTPHVDNGGSGCLSLLYYVNDSDGDTFLFDSYVAEGPINLSVVKRINPKKGKAVLFESHRFHASSNPIKSNVRAVINFVLQPTKESYASFFN